MKDGKFLSVAAAYDLWSGHYDGGDNPMVAGAREVINTLATTVAGLDVIELGCGTGGNLAIFDHAGAATLRGCDVSAGMLKLATQAAPKAELVLANIQDKTPFADASADFILFCLALEHVDDLEKPLAEAKRLLRANGRIALIEIHPDLAATGVKAHFETDTSVISMPTFAHTLDAYMQAATEVGLAPLLCRTWRRADFARPHPKMSKRSPEAPFILELCLILADAGSDHVD
jgi:ubiquinone/menaquinone biosynthesis C-methylase UbiE